MLNVKLLKRSKKLQKLIDDIEELGRQEVEVGHFQEQGIHADSGMPYTELMALHHFGYPSNNIPARPVKTIVSHNAGKTLKTKELKDDLLHWANAKDRENASKDVLDTIGKLVVNDGKSVFGSGQLVPNKPTTVALKGKNSPLIDKGDLQGRYAYKTSKDKVVKET